MINKALLSTTTIEGIFNNIVVEKQEVGNISIYRNELNNYVELYDQSLHPNGIIMIDASNFIKLYLKNIIELNFNSVLFAGLGIGAFPYLSQDNTSIVDVVEINNDIITMCNNMGHLKPNVNIINADIFTYTTDKKYDLIVFDIWNEKGLDFLQKTQELTTSFTNNLTENGEIHFPLLDFVN